MQILAYGRPQKSGKDHCPIRCWVNTDPSCREYGSTALGTGAPPLPAGCHWAPCPFFLDKICFFMLGVSYSFWP